MDFTDKRWAELTGGYRVRYDPRPLLSDLLENPGSGAAWTALWEELNYQGNVGEASYAAVPTLAQIADRECAEDWNPYGIAATIEGARLLNPNPEIPAWIAPHYHAAWKSLFASALRLVRHTNQENVIAGTLAVIAIHKGQRNLGRLALLNEDERAEMLATVGWG